MKITRKKIAFFGSSLVSAYWNGAATYYRGIIKALNERGYDITFFEPDAYGRQENRDIDDPGWARVVVYQPQKEALANILKRLQEYDILVKASGVGVFDDYLESAIIDIRKPGQQAIFWDVDAPATLDRIKNNPQDPFNDLIPQYDYILTYGGGPPVVEAYESFGAQACIPIYNALDTETHYPVKPVEQFKGDLAFLGNRLPDREKRVEEFFLEVAAKLPGHRFLLGGSGWDDKPMPDNVNYLGHVYTRDHNAFNCTPKMVLNISRDSMASYGFSPATRVFEAAGAGACIITDYWKGIEAFFKPGEEILIARNGNEVAEILSTTTKKRAEEIGRAALARVMAEHTYDHRAKQLDKILQESLKPKTTVE